MDLAVDLVVVEQSYPWKMYVIIFFPWMSPLEFVAGHATLACATASGSIFLLQVEQCLEFDPSHALFGFSTNVSSSFAISEHRPAEPDGYGIGILSWIKPEGCSVSCLGPS